MSHCRRAALASDDSAQHQAQFQVPAQAARLAGEVLSALATIQSSRLDTQLGDSVHVACRHVALPAPVFTVNAGAGESPLVGSAARLIEDSQVEQVEALVSARLRRSQGSCAASSASPSEPSIL